MSHRKHYKRQQGELVATSASPKEKVQKCKIAYENREASRKAAKEHINVPITITIGDSVSSEALRKLRKLRGVRYYVTLFSIKKECTPFEAAEYLKGGLKVEIVEGLKYPLTIIFLSSNIELLILNIELQ